VKQYTDELYLKILARFGVTNRKVLENEKFVNNLKDGIIKLAPLECSWNQMLVFNQLVECEESWSVIWDEYSLAIDGVVQLATVKKKGRKAIANILKAAPESEELDFVKDEARKVEAWLSSRT